MRQIAAPAVDFETPQLVDEQNRRLLGLGSALADALCQAHPDLGRAEALALSGATLGAVAVTLAHAPASDLRDTIGLAVRAATSTQN